MVDFLRLLLDRLSCKNTPSDESLNIINYALTEYQMYCANYNAIDTKASGIIQFVGILLGIIGLQSVKIQLNIFQFIALSSFLASLIFATLTWFVRDMLTVPRSTKVKDRINYLGQESGIEELLKCISEASTSVHDLIKRKLIYIKIAFSFMFLGVLMLIISYGVRMIS